MNVIIKSSTWHEGDIPTLFGDIDGSNVGDVVFAESTDLASLMVELGVYKSKSEARRVGRKGPVPEGWSDAFKASKKVRMWIWNPTE